MTEKTPQFTPQPHEQWSYIEHLAQASSIKPVILKKDLFDSQGDPLFTKGTQLDILHLVKLKRATSKCHPEKWFNIESAITQTGLSSRFAQLLHQHSDLKAIFDANELESPLQTVLQHFTQYRFFIQKITLLDLLLPDLFHKACYCTLLCLATARHLGLPYTNTQTLFNISMLRDIGVLYLSNLSNIKLDSSRDERLTKQILKLNAWVLSLEPEATTDDALLGLLEQYERADGSGFPRGDAGDTLSDLGQLLALTNKLYNTYWNYLEPKGLTLSACIPMLRLNNLRYKYIHYASISQAINCARLPQERHVADQFVQDFTRTLLATQQRLERWYKLAQSLNKQLLHETCHPSLQRLKRMMQSVHDRVETSGIFSECMGRWIEYVQVSELDVSYLEMEEIHLMLHEISDQLSEISAQLTRAIDAFAGEALTNNPNKIARPDPVERFDTLQGQLLSLVNAAV